MIEQLFFWQIGRGRNFSVATHPTKPFCGDVFAPLIKKVGKGRHFVRHYRIMPSPLTTRNPALQTQSDANLAPSLGERVPFFSPSSKSLYYHRNTKIPTERREKLILRARWHTISNASLVTCGKEQAFPQGSEGTAREFGGLGLGLALFDGDRLRPGRHVACQ